MCSLEAWVGGAKHLSSRHSKTGLRAAPLLQEKGLEAVAASGGLAEVALDGAGLPGQRGYYACGGGRWRLGMIPSPGLVLLRIPATQDLAF